MNVSNGIDNLAQIVPEEKISPSSPAAAGANAASKTQLANAAGSVDKASLSAAASNLSESAGASALTPEVRLDKVAGIQSALQAGSYHVSAADVAKKVVDALLLPES